MGWLIEIWCREVLRRARHRCSPDDQARVLRWAPGTDPLKGLYGRTILGRSLYRRLMDADAPSSP